MVKCFSITVAPNATAAIGTVIPKVWSDNPTGNPKEFFNVNIEFRLTSSKGAGYSEVQCNKVTLFFICFCPSLLM